MSARVAAIDAAEAARVAAITPAWAAYDESVDAARDAE
jgi:hypothetical protein